MKVGFASPATLPWASDLGNGGHDLAGYADTVDDMVSGEVVGHEPEGRTKALVAIDTGSLVHRELRYEPSCRRGREHSVTFLHDLDYYLDQPVSFLDRRQPAKLNNISTALARCSDILICAARRGLVRLHSRPLPEMPTKHLDGRRWPRCITVRIHDGQNRPPTSHD
jgi:hypothetical protein